MRKGITILLCGMFALSAPPAANRLWGQTEKKEALPDPAVKVGDMAPDFTLMDTHRNQVSLHDFRGKKVTFPLLSDWGGDVTRQYGLYNPKYKAARRVNYVIDKSGKVVEMQIDSDAVDPTKIVTFCERRKTKE